MKVARQKVAQAEAHPAQKELPGAVFVAWSRGDVGAARVLLAEHLRLPREGANRAAALAWQQRLGPDAYPLWIGAVASIVYAGAWAVALLPTF